MADLRTAHRLSLGPDRVWLAWRPGSSCAPDRIPCHTAGVGLTGLANLPALAGFAEENSGEC